MKLLELIEDIYNYKRLSRETWKDSFIVRKLNHDRPLALCDLQSMFVKDYLFTLEDFIAEDWYVI